MFGISTSRNYTISQFIIASSLLKMIIKKSKNWKTHPSPSELVARNLEEVALLNKYRRQFYCSSDDI